ncbi:CLUMA_CG008564, isoform A [Clunio marinus]|uniref:CLUMA_CG008564, isoform A n=1 Tax=Clunio marinus TaxID=568069 RepID=A0A1J1I809_9DIPT|nr:CLUMA_CG008564, isoform A [Clunio marinus]
MKLKVEFYQKAVTKRDGVTHKTKLLKIFEKLLMGQIDNVEFFIKSMKTTTHVAISGKYFSCRATLRFFVDRELMNL